MHKTHCPKCNTKLKNLCPTCGKEMELYSRVVGYFRPVQRWNDGKQEEWKDRTPYKDVEKSRIDKLRPEEG